MTLESDLEYVARAVPSNVRELCNVIHHAGHGVWCVGGAVRDAIRQRRYGTPERLTGDWDIATSAKPEQVIALFRRVIPSGIQHGTVTVLLGNQSYEVTTLRGEQGYSDGRHPNEVVFLSDITDDLARRDFTVNAIAYDPIGNRLIDPFGGITDIQSRTLRAVGDPLGRFCEDGLRVLRAARFCATLEMQIDPATLSAIRPSLAVYSRVSAERIREEWMKGLAARHPSHAFEIMQQHGMLDITAPELAATHGCTQNRYHRYDVWTHTLKAVDALDADQRILRLAALLHDVGKPPTRSVHPETKDYAFHGHEIKGAELAATLLRRLKFPNDVREQVVHLVRHHIILFDETWTDSAVRRWMNRVDPQQIPQLLELGRADIVAKGTEANEQLQRLIELQRRIQAIVQSSHALSLKDLRVSGAEIMKALDLSPGPAVGTLLRMLLDEVLEAPEHNERERLLVRARELLESIGKSDLRKSASFSRGKGET